jgi:hypothetical protein
MTRSGKLTRLQIAPYVRELRDTINSCLFRIDQLEQVAQESLRLDAQLQQEVEDGDQLDRVRFQAKINSQTHVFDHLDAFLGTYARLSLLIFPIAKNHFSRARGRTLQECLKRPATSDLNERGLRDSWAHFDERIDQASVAGGATNGQTFRRSAEVNEKTKRMYLRVVELDTLLIHYRNRDGRTASTDLRKLRSSIEALNAILPTAFDSLASGV